MHRWSPHCALGWLQAELEEAEQEAEVRGGPAGPGTAGRETHPIIPPNPRFILTLQGGEPLLQEAHPECLAPGRARHTAVPLSALDSKAHPSHV